MEDKQILDASSAEVWRDWLALHHASEREIWLLVRKKASKKPGVSYSAAVEEALCFGWIDSQTRRYDDDSMAQRFSPRRQGGNWTATNRAIAARLIAEGRMTDAGAAALPPDFDPTS